MNKEAREVVLPVIQSKEFQDRFWNRVNILADSECWDWKPKPFVNGYGHIAVERGGRRWMIGCHRVSYMIKHGAIPSGLCVLHSCDNRRCVNPSHLSSGTKYENMRQMWARGRGVTHSMPGDFSPSRKLHSGQMEAILILRKSGWRLSDIGKRFGVSGETIGNALAGKTWKGIATPEYCGNCGKKY